MAEIELKQKISYKFKFGLILVLLITLLFLGYIISVASFELLKQSQYSIILITISIVVFLFLIITIYAVLIAENKIVVWNNYVDFSTKTLFFSWKAIRVDLANVKRIDFKRIDIPVVGNFFFTMTNPLYIFFHYKDGQIEKIPVDNWGKQNISKLLNIIHEKRNKISIATLTLEAS